MNIIGLGNAGCQVSKNFEDYEQYKVFCIDTEDKGYGAFVPLKFQKTHEDYEKKYKALNLKKCLGPTTLILCGAGNVSGCALRIIEQLKDNPINLIYIKPDTDQLSHKQKLKDKVTFNVMQQYARSALLECMYIVENSLVETALENLSIKTYWQDINNVISSTYHMLNVFNNTEPLLASSAPRPNVARIGTFGMVNYDTNDEKLLYNIQYPRSKNYFYGINEKTLEEDNQILHSIRDFVKQKASEKIAANFSIFSTSYEHNYVYSTHYASFIQEQKIE